MRLEIAKGSNKALNRRGFGGLLPRVFGFIWGEIFIPLPSSLSSESSVTASAAPVGGVLLGTVEEVLIVPFLL